MAYKLDNRITAINEALYRADQPTTTLFDASKSLGALIIAIGYLVEIIQEQQGQIEELRDRLDYDPSCYDERRKAA